MRLETRWGLKILHGIRAELKRNAELNQPYREQDKSYFTGQNFGVCYFSREGSMATGLRVEDKLDGAVNFGAWKERMILLLQEGEL
jgi:hypothetical protein